MALTCAPLAPVRLLASGSYCASGSCQSVPVLRYVTWNSHISFSEETKLGATQEEERGWVAERRASGGDASASSPPDYPFICEVLERALAPGCSSPVFVACCVITLASVQARRPALLALSSVHSWAEYV